MPTENWWFWFERNPSQHFIAAIRRVFSDFEPVDAGWDKLGMAIQLRACKTVDEVRSMQSHDVELFLDLYWPQAVPAATAKTADKPKASTGAEYDVDAMLIETINKTAKRDFENNKEKADETLSRLGWQALADAIAEATARSIDERTLRRHAKPGPSQSNILKRWTPCRPKRKRGGKSAAKPDRITAVDVAGAAGQLATVSRAEQKVVQRPDLSQDRRTDRQRQQDEAEARWIAEGRRGTCSAKRCGEAATRLGDGRPWCADCYAEKFQGKTPDVIGIRPR